MSVQGVPLSQRISIASAITTATPDVRPAVCNALWPRLKAAHLNPRAAWRRVVRPIVTQPGAGASIRTTTPPVPVSVNQARYETVDDLECLYAYASRTQTRLGYGLRAVLYREDHDKVLGEVDAQAAREYRIALIECYAERPFYRAPELPSGWRRNHKAEEITDRVASVLQQLAAVAVVEKLSAEIEDALLS